MTAAQAEYTPVKALSRSTGSVDVRTMCDLPGSSIVAIRVARLVRFGWFPCINIRTLQEFFGRNLLNISNAVVVGIHQVVCVASCLGSQELDV